VAKKPNNNDLVNHDVYVTGKKSLKFNHIFKFFLNQSYHWRHSATWLHLFEYLMKF